ncbi:putative hydrolase of the HAD superfamily [Filimonas zeae]|uniref:Noncanonical pyrimidine nucleotidase, YjjG family protein n=1 Tax=Filimonas zeae TaxID=1737353 RepID=A0A917MYW8_9BACT|nr:YjjG family noncanonical pyrimidine nucleotidase [Filimonas zeae]MDR6342368.1 putative hydrolase of the HAD superfamily [Filimonas zeae]GGH81052.1 noncanonical pyrimidine nucleotidase, YjjG family protein [Filimonas zeae]
MAEYKHIFFDLDHTLWDFEANARDTLRELYAHNQLEARGVHDMTLFFERYSFHNDRLWDRYTKGFIKQEELRWKRMWFTLLDFKIGDEPLSKTMSVQFLDRLPYRTNLFPYTVEILNYLRDKGYRMHLITNGFDEVQRCKLESSNLTSYFEEMFTSQRCNSLKPHKEIFEYALKATGASVSESIMIGDNLDADIQGGMNAGLDTVFVNHLNVTPHVQPTYTVLHLKELEAIF